MDVDGQSARRHALVEGEIVDDMERSPLYPGNLSAHPRASAGARNRAVEDARRCVIGPCRRLRGGTIGKEAGTVRADTADMVHAVDAASNEPRALNESGRLLARSRHARALVRSPTRRRAR